MQAFETFTGLVATLNRANVDTDAIIPKQFLKSIQRTGFGENLFFDWARLPDGSPNPDFELNKPRFAGAAILVTRNNFGCGSSREHAVWAVSQGGYRCVIAPWRETAGGRVPAFADIFANNCIKNGVLTIQLSEEQVERIFQLVADHPGLEATVNLQEQQIVLRLEEPVTIPFDVAPATRDYLLRGLDEIGLSLEHEDAISAFEAAHDVQLASG